MILLADDDSDFAETCAMMLETLGYEVQVVQNAAQALAQIAVEAPDLLISDCCMPPGISGPQMSEQLRRAPVSRPFPILLMSGSLQCRVAPGTAYDGFLKKPFMAEDLLFQVRRLLPGIVPAGLAPEAAL